MDAIRDRNLLFGVLAVQLRGVTPAQLVEVSAAWAVDPAVSVPRRLVAKGILTEDDRVLLEKLVDDAIRAHGGNPGEVLELFGGEEHVEKTFFTCHDATSPGMAGTSPMGGPTFFAGSGREISGVKEAPGRYTHASKHASGGMGRVLIVNDEYLGRSIALKELLPGGAGGVDGKPSPFRQSASLVARFLQEARITSQLEHPAIVPVYELGRRQDGTLYYTMRLVRGKTFAEALNECTGLDQRLHLLSNFVSLCQAIAYAHSRGVIHRDIKPSNVMLGAFGETVVLDWGLAKVHDAEDVHQRDIRDTLHFLDLDDDQALPKTAYGRALGTPHYMPIEQAEGRIEAIDERSDVYSLGAVLYEMLTGSTPFSGKSTHEILEKVIHARPVPPLQTEPDAPPELAVICEKALQKDPHLRYQTAAELADEVQRFIDGSLVRAYRYTLHQIVSHYYSRHRLLVNAGLAFAAVLLLVGIVSYVSILEARNREHDQRLIAEAAQRSEAEARGAAEQSNYQSQIHLAQAHLREKEFGRANDVLWATAEKQRGWEWRYLLTRANPDVYTIEAPGSNLISAVFSPDGSKIGTNTFPAPPAIHDAQSGRKLVTLEGAGEKCVQTAFSPDGSKYMGLSLEGTVNVWDSASGKRLHRFVLNAQGSSAVFDSTGNLLFVGARDRKVHVFDLQRDAPAYELEVDAGAVGDMAMSPRKDRLLTVLDGASAQVWDLATKAPLFQFGGGAWPVFSPDGARIAMAQGTEAVVWDAETGAETARLRGHTDRILNLRFNSDGSRLISSSSDGTALLWDPVSKKALQTYTLPVKVPAFLAFFLGKDNYVLVCFGDNQCALFDARSGALISRMQGRGQNLNLADLRPDGTLLAVAPDDHSFEVLNPLAPTGVESIVAGMGTRDSYAGAISASASGELLALCRIAARESVWLAAPEEQRSLCSYSAAYGFIPLRPVLNDDGTRLAMIADQNIPVVVLNPSSAGPVMTAFTGHAVEAKSIALCGDGKTAASGAADGEICLWNTETAQPERRWKAHNGAVTQLHFTRDGQRLLSCGLDGEVVVWSCGTGEKLRSFARQEGGVVSAAFNQDETRVLTGDMNGGVQIWDAVSGASAGTASIGQREGGVQNQWHYAEALFWSGGNQYLTQYPYKESTLWDGATMSPLLFFGSEYRVLPLCGGKKIAMVDRLGNLRTLRMPVGHNGANLTREDFQRYQSEWGTRSAITPPKGAAPNYRFVSHEDLAQAVTGLIQRATAQTQPGQAALLVEANGRTQAMAVLGLDAGDSIVAVNDTRLTDAGAAKTALESAAGRLSQDPRAGLTLSVARDGQECRYCYWTLPLIRETAAVSLTRAEALGLVQYEIDEATAWRMVPASTDWLRLDFQAAQGLAAKVRLTCPVAPIAVHTVPRESIAALQQSLAELKESLAAGSAAQFSQTFREGAYKELTRTFTVAGG